MAVFSMQRGLHTLQTRHVPSRLTRSILTPVRESLRPRGSRWVATSTRDMTDAHIERMAVNQDRLMNALHKTCEWGTGLVWGWCGFFVFVLLCCACVFLFFVVVFFLF